MPRPLLFVCAGVWFLLTCGDAFASSGSLTCTPSNLWFGQVTGGQTKTLPATLTNTGSASLTVSNVQTSGAGFRVNLKLPLTLAVGRSVKFSVSFSPLLAKYLTGYVAFTSNASDPNCYVYVHGTGMKLLTANPSGLGFGHVPVGGSKSQYVALKNSGPSAVAISQATVTGAGFSLIGLNPPLTLASGQSVTFSIVFAPKSPGAGGAKISFSTKPSSPTETMSVWGYGTAASKLTLSREALNFGSVTVGSSKTLTISLNATGGNVTVTSVTSTSSEFGLSGGFPLTIGSGQSANLTVSFTPRTAGQTAAAISLVSNASSSPTVVTLAGTGTSASQHRVTLSWAPSSSVVVGYNVYRSGTSSGPYTKINPILDPNDTYTDDSVQAGKTYYYSTTAVNADGIESSHSSVVQAIIPNP
ncbi:MAG TPA: choice-of-anchor D domain-containing protein [Terriglobales bacterium]|nr:choice-of-anchor D domain-containing protein [Terriglobales bacterium]